MSFSSITDNDTEIGFTDAEFDLINEGPGDIVNFTNPNKAGHGK